MKVVSLLLSVLLIPASISFAQTSPFQQGHTNAILDVAFSPDDRQLVSFSVADGWLILWDLQTRGVIWRSSTGFLRKPPGYSRITKFFWSKDGKRLVTSNVNGTFQSWNLKTGDILSHSSTKPDIKLKSPVKSNLSVTKKVSKLIVKKQGVAGSTTLPKFGNNSALALSNDGKMIAEGKGWGDPVIKVTEIETKKSFLLTGRPGLVNALTFSRDGSKLAVGGTGRNIYVFDFEKKRLQSVLRGHENPIIGLAFGIDGDEIYSLDNRGTVFAWSLESLKRKLVTQEVFFYLQEGRLRTSNDGKYLLIASKDFVAYKELSSELEFRSIKAAEKFTMGYGNTSLTSDSVPAIDAVFTRVGNRIVTLHRDKTLRVWEASSGRQIKKFVFNENEPIGLANLGEEKVIVMTEDDEDENQIFEVDLNTGERGEPFKGDVSYLARIGASKNGRYVAASGVGSDLSYWDRITGAQRDIDFKDYTFDSQFAFSPDGRTIAVGGGNQNLMLIDVPSGKIVFQLLPDYQMNNLEKKLDKEFWAAIKNQDKKRREREKEGNAYAEKNKGKIKVTFSHFGKAESFWDKKFAETGKAEESKLRLSREKANVAWFIIKNDASLAVRIDTNSSYFNPRCKGLCDDSEVSLRYSIEGKNGEIRTNGIDVYAISLIPSRGKVMFPVRIEDFAEGKIKFSIKFDKLNPDNPEQSSFGSSQWIYVEDTLLPVN